MENLEFSKWSIYQTPALQSLEIEEDVNFISWEFK